VKLEQASKVKMWTPTRLRNGEGRTDREETRRGIALFDNQQAPVRSAGVVSTACEEGDLGQWGRLGIGWRVASPNAARKGGGQSGSRKGPYDRRGRVMPAEERALTSGVLVKEERSGD
jgi:hypothetical protein